MELVFLFRRGRPILWVEHLLLAVRLMLPRHTGRTSIDQRLCACSKNHILKGSKPAFRGPTCAARLTPSRHFEILPASVPRLSMFLVQGLLAGLRLGSSLMPIADTSTHLD